MKWNEMSTVRKVLTVLELVSGSFFWILFLLFSLNVLKTIAACTVLMFIHCLCRAFTEKNKVFKIIWAILAAIGFVLVIMQLMTALNA